MQLKSRLLAGLFLLTAFGLGFSSCSDRAEVPERNDDWCGTTGPSYYEPVENLICNVISVADKSYILPLDSISGVAGNSSLTVLRSIGKDEFSIIGPSEEVNLTPYIGKTVSITGVVKLKDQKSDSLEIDGKRQAATIYVVEKLKVALSAASRSAGDSDSCATTVSEEKYNWAVNLMNSRASSPITNGKFYIYVHVLRSSAGVGYNKETVASKILSILTNYYKSGNISFSLLGSCYHDVIGSTISSNQTSETIIRQTFTLSPHPEALDIYVLSNVNSGNIAGMAQDIPSTACAIFNENYTGITTAHEVGHCLGLFHTHFGTSGETSDKVKGVPELVNGSNSSIAGDFITDTPADPNYWFDGKYTGNDYNLKDANGQKYSPDAKNIMSYSGAQQYFTTKQFERIKTACGSSDELILTLARTLPSNQHLSSGSTVDISNVNSADKVTWTVKHYSGMQSSPQTKTSTSQSYRIDDSKSQYLELSARIVFPSGEATTLTTQATSGAPSPYIGTLAWSEGLNGQSGATTAYNFGSSVSVGENTTIRLEYLDPVQASLPGITFMCVTAANRMLRGTTFQLTKADCAQGFLKIRASDNCGTSDEFFTLETSVAGFYYSVDVQEESITFTGRMGTSTSGVAKAPGKVPMIEKITIFDSKGNLIVSYNVDSESSFTIPISNLSKGEYRAVISDGNGDEEVLFGI